MSLPTAVREALDALVGSTPVVLLLPRLDLTPAALQRLAHAHRAGAGVDTAAFEGGTAVRLQLVH